MVRLDIGRSCFCSGCWYKPTYLTQLCKTKSNTKKLYLCAAKSFCFDERSHFSFKTFYSSCASVGAFRRILDIKNAVHLSQETCNLPRILHNIWLSFWILLWKSCMPCILHCFFCVEIVCEPSLQYKTKNLKQALTRLSRMVRL